MFLSRGDRDLGVAFQTHPGRQAFISSGSKEPRSALESRRVSLGAQWVDSRESSLLRRWREVERLVSRPYRRRRPSTRDDGGVSGLFSSGGHSVRFLPRYDGEVSEPLVGRQGSRGSYQEGTGKSGSFGMWNHPRGHVWNVVVRPASRSEERRVGKECRSRWSPYH